jgi:hypothetical protein
MQSVKESDIFIVLSARVATTSNPRPFHYIIAVQSANTYYKLHARDTPGGLWEYKAEEYDFTMDRSLTAIVKIGMYIKLIYTGMLSDRELPGNFGGRTYAELKDLLAVECPLATTRENGGRKTKFDCVIWVRQAVQLLNQRGWISCLNAIALEQACEVFAL